MAASSAMRAQGSIAESLRAASFVPAAADTDSTGNAPPASMEDALHALYRSASVVFAGEVTSVVKNDGVVLVRFLVADGIRGAVSGSTYTLREWSGLWVDDPARYAVGEQRLMLLHATSAAGYASPVGGMLGAIRLHGDGVQATADLRWLATAVATAAAPVPGIFPGLHATAQGFGVEAVAVPDNAHVDGAMLSGMLHAWRRSEVAQ